MVIADAPTIRRPRALTSMTPWSGCGPDRDGSGGRGLCRQPDAEPDVRAAIAVIDAADLGDEDAELTVGDAQDHDLAWYATQELPFLLDLLWSSGACGTVARVTTQVRLGAAVRALISPVTTPLLPDDYLKPDQPAVVGPGIARPDRRGAPRDRRLGHPGDQAGLGLPRRSPTRSVHRYRPVGRRPLAMAVLLADLTAAGCRIAHPEHHRQSHAGGILSSHLVGGVRPGRWSGWPPAGNLHPSGPAAAGGAVLTAGSGHHPGDVDAADHGAAWAAGRRRRRASAQRADTGGRHVLRRTRCAGRNQRGYRLTVRATRTAGRLDLSRLGDVVPDWRDWQTWACGPEACWPRRRRPGPPRASPTVCTSERFAAGRAAVGPAETVTFARSGVTRTADAATSLLEAGEQAGIRMPFGCRMGICHTCVVSLVDGRVVDLRNGAEHEPGSRVQVCVTAPSGDCVVDI